MAIDRNKTLANAQKYVRKGQWEKAVREYQALVRDDPRDVRCQLKIADIYAKLDRVPEALRAYKSVAYFYLEDDIYDKAVAVFKQALRLAPEAPELHRDLGEAYFRLGRLKDSLRSFHQAQRIYKDLNQAAAQRQVLERMVEVDPEDIGLRIQLAERYAKEGLRENAVEMLQASAERFEREGRLDEFIQVAERLIYLKPTESELRRRVVRLYTDRGDDKRALRHLKALFKDDPTDIITLEALGRAFHNLGSPDKAVLVYRELATVYLRNDSNAQAIDAYQQILLIRPDDAGARKALDKLGSAHTLGEESSALARAHDTGAGLLNTQSIKREVHHTPSPDALAGVEFLDEDSEDFSRPGEPLKVVQNAPAGVEYGTSKDAPVLNYARRSFDDISEADGSSTRVPGVEIEPVRYAESRHIEDDASASAELVASSPSTTEAGGREGDLLQLLTEARVFLKYGLHDKAIDVLTRAANIQHDHLETHELLFQLFEAMGDVHRAVEELVTMARLTCATPKRSRSYLEEALPLVDDPQSVYAVFDELGFDRAHSNDSVESEELALLSVEAIAPLEESSDAIMQVQRDEGTKPEKNVDPALQDKAEALGQSAPRRELRIRPLIEISDDEFDELFEGEKKPAAAKSPSFTLPPLVPSTASTSFEGEPSYTEPLEDIDHVLPPRAHLSAESRKESAQEPEFELLADEAIELDPEEAIELDLDEVIEMEASGLIELDVDALPEVIDNAAAVAISETEILDDLTVERTTGLRLTSSEAESVFDELFGDVRTTMPGTTFLNRDDPLGEMAEVDFLLQQGLVKEAEETLKQLETKHSAHPGIRSRRLAIEHLRVAVPDHNPFAARSLSQRFPIELSEESSSSAFDAAKKTGTLDVGEAINTNFELGAAYLAMGLYDQAIEEFRQALDDPDVAGNASYNIALCEMQRGDPDTAQAILSNLINSETTPENVVDSAVELLDEVLSQQAP